MVMAWEVLEGPWWRSRGAVGSYVNGESFVIWPQSRRGHSGSPDRSCACLPNGFGAYGPNDRFSHIWDKVSGPWLSHGGAPKSDDVNERLSGK